MTAADRAWDKKIEKAMSAHMDGHNVIAIERILVEDKKGVLVIARDPSAVTAKDVRTTVDGWPVEVEAPEAFLSVQQIEAALLDGGSLEWHPMYDRERWRDKDPPLEIVGIWKIPGEETRMVMYRCPDRNCLGCRHPTSPAGTFHHKLVRPDGTDWIGRAQEIQRGKRSSETVLVDQPVFRRYGAGS